MDRDTFNTLLKYLSRLITMFLVLPLHECAHALVAKWFGDDTAERQGRITLNPVAHIDPIGGLLMLFTGFGWAKPVPINPLRMKKYRAGISVTALAGPVSNLLAALAAAFAFRLMNSSDSGKEAFLDYSFKDSVTPIYSFMVLCFFLVHVNVGLAVFNLIPLPPLDGFNVLRYFTSEKFDRWFYQHQREIQYGFLALLILLSYIPSKYNVLYIARKFIVDNVIWRIVGIDPDKLWIR